MTATLANTAALVYVADLVTDALNDAQFGEGVEFTAERSYADWDLMLEDADQLHVDVVPVGHATSDLNSRGNSGYLVTLNIGIRKRFGQAESDQQTGRIDKAEVDRLVLLVEQIHELLCSYQQRNLASNVSWRETKITDTYVAAHLRQDRQFTGLILCTFHVKRALPAPDA